MKNTKEGKYMFFLRIVCSLALISSLAARAYDIKKLCSLSNLPEDVVVNLMHEFQFIEDWNEPSATYYKTFPKIINQHGFKKGCEIGVSTGGNSYSILEKTQVEKLYSIDTYAPDYWIELHARKVLDLYVYRIKMRLGTFENRSELLRLFSEDAAKLFVDEELDFVFIDGDHAYKAVMQDLSVWYPKVRAGGIIGGDDYWDKMPDVILAVNDFFNPLGMQVHQDSEEPRIWWVQK